MIEIKDINGNSVLKLYSTEDDKQQSADAVALGSGSVWVRELGGKDCIRLKFSLDRPLHIGIGYHIETESYGRFTMTSDYSPEYNAATGGYDYEVAFDAWYHSWNRYLFMLHPQHGARETSFNLTDRIMGHISLLEENIEQRFGPEAVEELFIEIQPSVSTEKAVNVTYDSLHIVDAISAMAEAFECEWWMQDGNHLCFGRCERDNDPMEWTAGRNAASITPSGSSGAYATRLYVFGGTANIPKRYRKKLVLAATEIDAANGRFRDANRKLYPSVFAASVKDENRVTTTASWGGVSRQVRLNPDNAGAAKDEASWIYCDAIPAKGTSFTIEGVMLGRVDASYFTSDYGDDSAIAGWEQRLMMPADSAPGNHIDSASIKGADGKTIEEMVVEQVVVFDDVYPHKRTRISRVDSYTTETEDQSDENGNAPVTVTHYRLMVEKGDFEFSEDYLLPGQTLRCTFMTGKMAGMSFDLKFGGDVKGTSMQEYEVINSEDYGVLLPNTQLYPSEGDEMVLTGYDVSYLSADGNSLIASAEEELERKGREYQSKLEKNKATYTVQLEPQYAADEDTIVYLGSKVTLRQATGELIATSRVIAMEVKLDIPYDTPVYTVGESRQYSRLSEIEGKVSTVQSQLVMGGAAVTGSGVEIITSDSGRQPTDSNVYSALASDNRFLSKTRDDTAKGRITFDRGWKTRDAIDSMLTGRGTLVSEDGGRVQTDELEVRKSMKVTELIINRLRAMAGDFVFAETRKVTKVELIGYEQGHDGSAEGDELYGIYKLTLDKDTDFDFHAFHDGDIVYQIVNTIPIGGTDYHTGFYHIASVDTDDNSITVFLYHDDDLGGIRNHIPMADFNIAHRGHVDGTEEERLSQWLLSSAEGRITFLDNLTQPLVSQRNYAAYIGKFLSSLDYGRDLPIRDSDTVVFARHLLAENIYMVDYNGEVVVQQPERGEWSLETAMSDKPYRCVYTDEVEHVNDLPDKRHTLLTQDKVTHLGSSWICIKDKTTQEPWVDSSEWKCVNGNNTVQIEVHSSAGQMFRQGRVDTELYVRLLYNGNDITGKVAGMELRSLRWTRETGNAAEDAAWNDSHETTRSGLGVRIVQDTSRFDLGTAFFSERRTSRFTFTLELPVAGSLGTVSYSETVTIK